MKIGIISHLKHPIRQPFAGGLEAFTFQITQALQNLDHEVLLFASDSSDPQLPLFPILSDEHYDMETGIRKKLTDLPSEYIAEHHAYFNLMMQIDDYNLDVIFNNSLHYIPITMANAISTPMLTVLHTPPFYELKLAITREQRAPVIKYVTVSAQSANNWSELIENCPVILNGIHVESWKFFAVPSRPAYAIWFGRIHPDKGLHLAILAARDAGLPLRVAGAIADRKYYQTKILPLLGEDIQLLGLLEHEELNQQIGEASVCLVTPCWEEPFGLVVAEAMACGTPVAGFEAGALPELLTKETGVLAKKGDVTGLSAAILQAQKLDRGKVREYAISKFSYSQMTKKYEHMLGVTSGRETLKYAL